MQGVSTNPGLFGEKRREGMDYPRWISHGNNYKETAAFCQYKKRFLAARTEKFLRPGGKRDQAGYFGAMSTFVAEPISDFVAPVVSAFVYWRRIRYVVGLKPKKAQ